MHGSSMQSSPSRRIVSIDFEHTHVYYPGTEELGEEEIRLTALGRELTTLNKPGLYTRRYKIGDVLD